ncbi:hypothetical protein ACFUJR_39170 [Streptomyces sp. NPDC057271]|uniref:hypothetical protein n=1 Tax=unclassified Streptomyces TaxID=2593676 RepID=UPI00363F2D00
MIESVLWASEPRDGESLLYVEGWALEPYGMDPHAWCATAAGEVRDVTWSRPSAAYLGLPLAPAAARELMVGGPVLHGRGGMVSMVAKAWMRDGVPAGLLADAGRALPSEQ